MSDPTTTRAEDAPVILVLNRDLMFGSRISSVCKSLGRRPRIVKDVDTLVSALDEGAERIALVIVDMNAAVDWERIRALIEQRPGLPVLGFGPHVDVEGRRAGKAAGVTRLISNGEFHRDPAAFISRYERVIGNA